MRHQLFTVSRVYHVSVHLMHTAYRYVIGTESVCVDSHKHSQTKSRNWSSVNSLLMGVSTLQLALLAFVTAPATTWLAGTSWPRSSCGPFASSEEIARCRPAFMMGKKTTWSIGNARKKGKGGPQSARQSAAGSTATGFGSSAGPAKGFGITKEKLAKALGEMTVAEAVAYLSGPEPKRAGISDEVAAALCAQIVDAAEAAKRTLAGNPATQPAMLGPEDDSAEALRTWREYCKQALETAEEMDRNGAVGIEPPADDFMSRLQAAATDDIPLFKPRVDAPGATVSDADGAPRPVASPPQGFEWGQTL